MPAGVDGYLQPLEFESRRLIPDQSRQRSPIETEFVVDSADLDHIGIGAPVNGDTVYNGAMDNSAGVASSWNRTYPALEWANETLDFMSCLHRRGRGREGISVFAEQPTVGRKKIVADLN